MNYEFSTAAFFIGVIILVVGVVGMRFHQVIADNLGSGVASYDRYKLFALIACILGFIVMLNLHSVILGWFFGMVFGRGSA